MRVLITGGSGFIGTNLIDLLLNEGVKDILNIDIQSPLKKKQNQFWERCNILDKENLQRIFSQFNPTHVIHLAARTDTASPRLEDYYDNTEGSASLIEAVERCSSIVHTIITSTQYVYKSNEKPLPISDDDYQPHTAYGVSKKITEELTRNSTMSSAWTIIRPTNVWGPWNMRYPNEFLKIIDKGLYFHPSNSPNVKSYAYVKNVVYQIYRIITLPLSEVNKQVFYVGDLPMQSIDWINEFSTILTGEKVKIVPKQFLRLVSYGGDSLRLIGIPFPLHSVRFKNMIDDYNTPMEKTLNILGLSHPDLTKNVEETILWIKNEGNEFFEYWQSKR